MDIGDIKGGVWCHGAYGVLRSYKDYTHATLEKGGKEQPSSGPMTPYTSLNIANIHNIDLIPGTPLNIF